jgi:hypothetical protein
MAFSTRTQIVASLYAPHSFFYDLFSFLLTVVKVVPRAYTACADAYLTPCIREYLKQFVEGFDDAFTQRVRLTFMQSDGGLARIDDFTGYRAVLSGPAGGVVGYARTTGDAVTRHKGVFKTDDDGSDGNDSGHVENDDDDIDDVDDDDDDDDGERGDSTEVIGFDMGGTRFVC